MAVKPPGNASTTDKGLVKLATPPDLASNPLAVGDNDPRLDPPTPASVSNLGVARLSVSPEDPDDPIGVGDNDVRLGAGTFDGDIQVELSHALLGADRSAAVLGVLDNDLYVFGSGAAPSYNTTMGKRVKRLSQGETEWEDLVTGLSSTYDFKGGYDGGAVEFRRKLYIGRGDEGQVFRLDLEVDGSFDQITILNLDVGALEAWPITVLWNRMYFGTYGVAGLYRWDGVAGTATLVKAPNFVDATDGHVASAVVYEGRLWVSFISWNNGVSEIWAIDQDDTAELIYSGAASYVLKTWNDSLIANRIDGIGPLVVYRHGAFVPITVGDVFSTSAIAVTGDQLVIWDHVNGPSAYRYDGAMTALPLPLDPPGGFEGPGYPTIYNGSLWWVTSEKNSALLRIPIGSDRLFKQLSRSQISQGGAVPARRLVSDKATLGPVLMSPNGKYWRVSATDLGALTTTDLGTTRPGS